MAAQFAASPMTSIRIAIADRGDIQELITLMTSDHKQQRALRLKVAQFLEKTLKNALTKKKEDMMRRGWTLPFLLEQIESGSVKQILSEIPAQKQQAVITQLQIFFYAEMYPEDMPAVVGTKKPRIEETLIRQEEEEEEEEGEEEGEEEEEEEEEEETQDVEPAKKPLVAFAAEPKRATKQLTWKKK